MPTLGAGCPVDSSARRVRYVAVAPPEIPPMRTPTRRRAAARPPLTIRPHASLPPRHPRCFRVRASRGLPPPSGRSYGVRLDHLANSRGTHLEVHVCIRLDRHVPGGCDLELLVHTLESLLGIGDRVNRPRRHLTRRIDGNCYVKVPGLRVNGDF